ncbi:MAG: sigma-70 family RNA polymerase sigma factor [Planctomycetota bacterium]|jgi:RNA polymerase sigma-70 factor (ECF subfamily)|nr:sigma-70 family RNA polymerase sigma factor [Planctomycetota bacterium]
MELSDSKLMLACAQGDSEAFQLLVERHQHKIINFFYRLSWNRDLAEDCCQEVFCRIYRNRQQYQATAKFTTYLYRVARNLWIDHCRKMGRRPREVSLQTPIGSTDKSENTQLADTLPAPETTPQTAFSRSEIQNSVREAIDSLPEPQRLVVLLAESQGMNYQEISEVLEIPVGTVKSRMHTAVGRLRDKLSRVERT